jgi:hypothetical protein
MRTTCLLSLPLALLLGCTNAPAPATQAEKTPAAEPAIVAAPATPDVKVADASKTAEPAADDGCVYKEAHKEEEGCPSPDQAVGSGTPGHFGAVFALKEPKPLSQALASAKDLKDPVQVSGEVESVCQKKGCWLVVKDGEAQARILMKDHSFTVPMDIKGKPVIVEGTLETRTFNEAQTKHLAKDAGKDPATVSGETNEYVLTATAVQLKNS